MFKVGLLAALGLILIFFGTGGDRAVNTSLEAVSLEDKVAELCSSLEGVGNCRVLISYEEKNLGYGKGTEEVICGIVVVCEGGDNSKVRARITSMLSALYGIGSNRIQIEKLGTG